MNVFFFSPLFKSMIFYLFVYLLRNYRKSLQQLEPSAFTQFFSTWYPKIGMFFQFFTFLAVEVSLI